MGRLDGIVIIFGISIKKFFQREKTADVITFDIKRKHGKSAGNPAVTFNKRMDGNQNILRNGRFYGGMDVY